MTGLVNAEELQQMIADDSPVIVDCRYRLDQADAGEQAYQVSHIPGAHYAHLGRDLAGAGSASAGRHPLPDPGHFTALLQRFGAGQDRPIVIYDDAAGLIALRFWWLCRWVGFDCVRLLDGGWQAWLQGGNTSTQLPGIESADVSADYQLRSHLAVNSAELKRELAQDQCLLIDARAVGRYCGEVDPIDPVAGHIPGAVNRPTDANLDANGKFLPADLLRQQFLELMAGKSPQQVIHSCGSGVSACHNLFAMELAGLTGSRLFAPSWSGWIAESGNRYVRGDGRNETGLLTIL